MKPAARLAPLLSLLALVLASCAIPGLGGGDGTSDASPSDAAPSATDDASPSADEDPAASDGGSTAAAEEPVEGAALSCGTFGAAQLEVLVLEGPVDCTEVQDVLSRYEAPEDTLQSVEIDDWTCTWEVWASPVGQDEFTDTVLCEKDGQRVRASAPGTVPLVGTGVEDVADWAFPQVDGSTWYAFTVPGTDLVCSIMPSLEGGRAGAGCMGSFPGADPVQGGGGEGPPNAAMIGDPVPEANGLQLLGDPAYMPLTVDGSGFEDPSELPVGTSIYAFGVVCAVPEAGTVSCTAGESAMTLVPAQESYAIS